MYEKYVRMYDGAALPFVQYAAMVRDQQPYRSPERLFRTTVRAKRGIMDTGARDQQG